MSCQESEARSYGGKPGPASEAVRPEQGGHTAWLRLWLRHKQVSLLPPGCEECLGINVDTRCSEGRAVKAADVTLGSENKNTPAPAPRERKRGSCH